MMAAVPRRVVFVAFCALIALSAFSCTLASAEETVDTGPVEGEDGEDLVGKLELGEDWEEKDYIDRTDEDLTADPDGVLDEDGNFNVERVKEEQLEDDSEKPVEDLFPENISELLEEEPEDDTEGADLNEEGGSDSEADGWGGPNSNGPTGGDEQDVEGEEGDVNDMEGEEFEGEEADVEGDEGYDMGPAHDTPHANLESYDAEEEAKVLNAENGGDDPNTLPTGSVYHGEDDGEEYYDEDGGDDYQHFSIDEQAGFEGGNWSDTVYGPWELFYEMDIDQDTFLSEKEREHLIKALVTSENKTETEVRVDVNSKDTNGDGFLSVAEWSCWWGEVCEGKTGDHAPAPPVAMYVPSMWGFDDIDRDPTDDKLTVAELLRAVLDGVAETDAEGDHIRRTRSGVDEELAKEMRGLVLRNSPAENIFVPRDGWADVESDLRHDPAVGDGPADTNHAAETAAQTEAQTGTTAAASGADGPAAGKDEL